MSIERESNYDLLRIISAFSIVMLHVSAGFLKYDDIKSPTNCSLPIIILNTLTRFAVPCFFMMSGAFLLADDKNAGYKSFYKAGGVNLYGRFTIIFLSLASVSYVTSDHSLNWDIGLQLCFLSYFLMGYKFRTWGKKHKNNKLALIFIAIGMIINIGLGYINYLRGLGGLPVDVSNISQNPFSYGPLASIEVVASCLIFAGFSVMTVKIDLYRLSRLTFLIYLIHAGVRDVIWEIVGDRVFGNVATETGSVVILSIAVFSVSLTLAVVYRRFEQKISRL